MDIRSKKICVVGSAKSGIAAANLAMDQGALVSITDSKPLADIDAALSGLRCKDTVRVEAGGHTKAFVQDSDYVVASPGVWRDAPPLQWAREAGIPVMGEIEFAWRFCRKPVVAVTGSNGKTTTVTLIAQVLQAGGNKVCLCGNIGTPFAQHVLDASYDIFVVEISSFQLELIDTFHPAVAVVTNFSQNHLDRHPDMQDYFDAKKRIFMNQTAQDHALINARDEWSQKLPGSLKAQVIYFNQPASRFNSNQSTAYEVGRIFNVPEEKILTVFESFGGVEHRLERVRELNGVLYLNDSKSTTVESGRWALTSTASPIIMICGGHDKGMDYTPLRDLVKAKVKKMVVLTREDKAREVLHAAFDGVVPLEDHTDMQQALLSIRRQAAAGDTVLLSPMFASFDMFNNFEHRGKVFKQLVREL